MTCAAFILWLVDKNLTREPDNSTLWIYSLYTLSFQIVFHQLQAVDLLARVNLLKIYFKNLKVWQLALLFTVAAFCPVHSLSSTWSWCAAVTWSVESRHLPWRSWSLWHVSYHIPPKSSLYFPQCPSLSFLVSSFLNRYVSETVCSGGPKAVGYWEWSS